MVTYSRLYDVIRAIHAATGQVPLRVATQRSDALYATVQYVEHPPEQLEIGKRQHTERRGRVHQVQWRHVQWPEREVTPAVWERPSLAQGLYQLRHEKRTWLFWDFGDDHREEEPFEVVRRIVVEVPWRER